MKHLLIISCVLLVMAGHVLAAQTVEIPLSAGWNAVAVPVETGLTVRGLLQEAEAQGVDVDYAAVLERGGWRVYSIVAPTGDAPVEAGVGYLIYSRASGTITLSGDSVFPCEEE